jgi:SAM-dependent methyltransferase
MKLIVILLFILLIFLFAHVAGGKDKIYHIDDFKGVASTNVPISDVRFVDTIQYRDLTSDKIRTISTRKSFYKDWKSDQQISQVMKYGNKIDKLALILLFSKLLFEIPLQTITEELFAVKSDKQFYSGFFKNNYKPADEDLRAETRAEIMWSNLKYLKLPVGCKMLEIGCGTGKITEYLDNIMRFSEIHCIEIHEGESKKIKFHKPEKNGHIKQKNNYFDLIVASLSLHHIEDINVMVRELYRVIKPGGFLVIREHTSWDVFDAMVIDIEHMAYMIGAENKKWEDCGTGYGLPVRFPNPVGWDKILEPFKWISHKDEFARKYKDFRNPTNISWMTYVK